MILTLISSLALVGFALSLWVHCMALCGVATHVEHPESWMLHLGVFIVFIPTLIVTGQFTGRTRKSMKELYTKRWMGVIMVFGVYAFINFFANLGSIHSGAWTVSEDKTTYTFTPKGGAPEVSSKKEYDRQQAQTDRLFSGHWMMFYIACFAMIKSKQERERLGVEKAPRFIS